MIQKLSDNKDTSNLNDRFASLVIAKRSLAEEVATRLRTAIWNEELLPGEPLVEPKLAQSIGVSRGPIREALDQLEREGLVVKEPNRTARIAQLSKKDLHEVFSLRLALERLALEEAIHKADTADLDNLQAVVDAMAAAMETELTTQEAADLEMRFHEGIVRASKHERLYEIWKTLRSQIYIFLLQIRAFLKSRDMMTTDFKMYIIGQHQRLVDAIRTGNKEDALAEIEEHIHGSYDRIVQSYRPLDDEHEEK